MMRLLAISMLVAGLGAPPALAQDMDFGGGDDDSLDFGGGSEEKAAPAEATPEPEDGGKTETIEAKPAQGSADAADEAAAAAAKQQANREALQAIVRGFYLEARLGGGYMVVQQPVRPTPTFPTATGDEGYTSGVQMQVGIGYDLTDFLALELLGGGALVSGTRSDLVRDLGLWYGGAGVRGTIGLTDRLKLVLGAGAAYGRADTGVPSNADTGVASDKGQSGVMALGTLGLEYFVHVRHFSIGLSANGLVPFQPMRVFVGAMPHLKYTF